MMGRVSRRRPIGKTYSGEPGQTMIIDAHAHLGSDEVFDVNFTEDTLVASRRANNIQATLLQPGTVHDLAGVQRQHDDIAELCSRFPGRYHGIANPSPHLPAEQYEVEVRRCIEQLRFVGVKLHPLAHAVDPLGRHGRRVFELALALPVPVIVHSGIGIPWADPSLLSPIAEEWPELAIVVAHAGGAVFTAQAELLAARHPNVYLETSWTPGSQVLAWARKLGPQRLMFGSDHADNAAAELAKLRSTGLDDEELLWVLGRTAATVFPLDSSQRP